MKIREEFVLRALGKAQSFAEVCRDFNVSRKTGYKWVARYKEQGLTGLVDESRRPDCSPTKVDDEMVELLVALRRDYPTWGPKKLRVLVQRRKPTSEPPSEATIARVLRENGFAKKAPKQRAISAGPPVRPPRLDPLEPNDVWTVDFKGWWRTRDGIRCEPLTVRDAVSRFVLGVRVLGGITTERVAPAFEVLFDRYGLPKTIQTDNGPPFASQRGLAGLSRLSAWWVSLGINVVRSRPGCPQDNGGHERMHGDMLALQHASAESTVEQQRLLDEWATTFNHVRPHEALAMKTPGEVYRTSPRRRHHQRLGGFPADCALIAVKGNTAVWKCHRLHVGAAFADFPVGIRVLDEESVEVWFFHMRLGTWKPGVPGSFEVDGELVAPLRGVPRARGDVALAAIGSRAAATSGRALASLLATAGAELSMALARTQAAIFGTTETSTTAAVDEVSRPGSRSAAGDLATKAVASLTVTRVDCARHPVTPRVTSCGPIDGDTGRDHVEPAPGNAQAPATRAGVTGGDGVDAGGGRSGLQVSPPSSPEPNRGSLRLRPPAIPAGWPWVSDAGRPVHRRRNKNKEPSTT